MHSDDWSESFFFRVALPSRNKGCHISKSFCWYEMKNLKTYETKERLIRAPHSTSEIIHKY